MGKKNLNPADAHRKALRKKEKEKNKEARVKAREVKTLKTDTGELDAEIRQLEASSRDGKLDKASEDRLRELRSEVSRVRKAKADYVAAHPEQRSLVYGERKERKADDAEDSTKGLFRKNGLPKHPERSIYYDPVLNPFGMPPPGMPYVEKPEFATQVHSSGEDSSDDSSSGEEEDGPSSRLKADGAADSDDEIPLPPGPPPLPPGFVPPLPKGPPPRLPQAMPPYGGAPLPFPQGFVPPPPPPGFGPPMMQHHPGSLPVGSQPPPPPPFGPGLFHQATMYAPPAPLPPGFSAPIPATQPSSLGPSRSLPPPPPGLPVKPVAAAATIVAEPELRDFKKESTAFVPAALKRKRQTEDAPIKAPKTDDSAIGPSRPSEEH